MSESTTSTESTEAATAEQGDPAGDAPLGEAGKSALKAERQRANTAERELKQRDESISELQAAVEQLKQSAAEATAKSQEEVVSAFRDAAVKFGGIDEQDAELFLTGDSLDDIKTKAERLLERSTAPSTPRPDPTQGGSGSMPLNGDPILDAVKSKLGIA